jgi:hypothetical protein
MHTVRHWTSFFVGALIFVLGFLPLIGKAPAILDNVPAQVLSFVVAFGGLYLIIDSFFEYTFHSGVFLVSFLVGLLVFGFGLVSVLHEMGKIAFSVTIDSIVYNILFMLEGLFLMLACFVMD